MILFLIATSADFIFISQKDPLPKKFTCLFCNHEEAVTVSLDKKGGVGLLDCNVCGQNFQCGINCTCWSGGRVPPSLLSAFYLYAFSQDLSEAVDVYGEWVDAAG